ncbi:MAG: hypothetical protein NVS1B14_11610 [Vulcanimicrobiaceae bacterium]
MTAAFDRSGYAALSDLRSPGYPELFAFLETVQRGFLDRLSAFRDPKYGWESDTLHNWSRAWEYAFVLRHLKGEQQRCEPRRLQAIDFGSGSTFFSFAVARCGIDVTCFDNDPVVVSDLQAATAVLDCGGGSIKVEQNGRTLPCESGSADVAYSVSVLEHMPDPVPIVAEIARALKPGGVFILTLDVDIEGASGVPPAHFNQLREHLALEFAWVYPERIIHPQEVLTSKNSPWPRSGERHIPGLLLRDRSGGLHPLIGGPNPGVLTVYGCVLRRR